MKVPKEWVRVSGGAAAESVIYILLSATLEPPPQQGIPTQREWSMAALSLPRAHPYPEPHLSRPIHLHGGPLWNPRVPYIRTR